MNWIRGREKSLRRQKSQRPRLKAQPVRSKSLKSLPHSPSASNLKSHKGKTLLRARPSFPDVPDISPILERLDRPKLDKRPKLDRAIIDMLIACHTCYDFRQVQFQDADKKKKSFALKQILDYLQVTGMIITKDMAARVLKMVSIQIFRDLCRPEPPISPIGWEAQDANPPEREPAWDHICPAYEILYTLVDSTVTKIESVKPFVTKKFVVFLINNLESRDADERAAVRFCLHKVYNNFVRLRKYMLMHMAYLFLTYAQEDESFQGIKELLELLGSIISGFVTPLKPFNETFYKRILIPLHKCRNYLLFASQLTYCIQKYIQKKPSLAQEAVKALIWYWPKQRARKQIAFSCVLDKYLGLTSMKDFRAIQEIVFHHYAKCCQDPHMQVAECAMLIWNDSYFVGLAAQAGTILPQIMVPALHATSKNHWHPTVKKTATNLLKSFQVADPEECQRILRNISKKERAEVEKSKRKANQWDAVVRMSKGYGEAPPKPRGMPLIMPRAIRPPEMPEMGPRVKRTARKDSSGSSIAAPQARRPYVPPARGDIRRAARAQARKAVERTDAHETSGSDEDEEEPSESQSEKREVKRSKATAKRRKPEAVSPAGRKAAESPDRKESPDRSDRRDSAGSRSPRDSPETLATKSKAGKKKQEIMSTDISVETAKLASSKTTASSKRSKGRKESKQKEDSSVEKRTITRFKF